MRNAKQYKLKDIPVDEIEVLNPRERNQQVFSSIVTNISRVGLKKPITVTQRDNLADGKRYLLVCGEGRLQAFKQLGQRTIPSIVLDVSDEDAFIMSLTENIARRKISPLETVSTIMRLKSLGYSHEEIAAKVDLSKEYVNGITMLMEHGEERLVAAVEIGKIGLSNALQIFQAAGDDQALQKAMHDAYENGSLRGRQFVQVRRLIERRARLGKDLSRSITRKSQAVTSQSLVKTYRTEVERQKYMVRKAESTQQRILLIVEAMRTLTADENFVTLLRAESLDTMPKFLFDRMISTELRSS